MGKRAKRIFPIESEYMERYEQQQKRKQRRQTGLARRLIAAGIVMLVLAAIITHYHIGQRTVYSEKMTEYEALQAELTNLERVESELLEEIGLLNDDAYILDIARTNYFLSKEGELIFQLEDFSSSY